MPRVVVPVLVVVAFFVTMGACGGETKTSGGGAAPPPGAGYGSSSAPADEMRVLSRDDCIALRDHQIDIAVAEAITGNDPGKRLEIEAKVRSENKEKTEAWVKSCSGRTVPAKLLRCWKDAGTPQSYVACDLVPGDGAVDG